MKRFITIYVCVFASLAAAADCCTGSAGIIASIKGDARGRSGAASARLALLDWIAAGVIVETGQKSAVTIILTNGRRWELGESARATVKPDAVAPISGPVRELAAIPPVPKPKPIAGDSGDVAGAVRFRGPSSPRALYPHSGATAIPDSVKLSFAKVEAAAVYRLTLLDESGAVLWTQQTPAISSAVPEHLLMPGKRYRWRVRAIGESGVLGEAEEQFETLPEASLAERRNFRAAIQQAADPNLAAVLASADLKLGLFAEAVDEFSQALRQSPDAGEIRAALAAAKSAVAGGEQ